MEVDKLLMVSYDSLLNPSIVAESTSSPFKSSTLLSVWKSGLETGKRLGLDQTQTDRTGNSQDRKRPQPQSGLRSFTISKIPGPHEDQFKLV